MCRVDVCGDVEGPDLGLLLSASRQVRRSAASGQDGHTFGDVAAAAGHEGAVDELGDGSAPLAEHHRGPVRLKLRGRRKLADGLPPARAVDLKDCALEAVTPDLEATSKVGVAQHV